MGSGSTARSVVAALLALTVVLGTAPGVVAAEERAGGSVTIQEGETVGDLSAAGGSVTVHGTVDGDLEAVAGSVLVTGRVTGDVEVAGGSVVLARGAEIGGSVEAGTGSFVLEEGARVGGDLTVGAGDVVVAGTVEDSLRAGAESLRIASTAVVGGDVEYDAEEYTLEDGAEVGGTVTQVDDLDVGTFPGAPGFGGGLPAVPGWAGTVYGLLSAFLLGAVLLLALPGVSGRVVERVTGEPGTAAAVGLLVLFGTPVVLLLVAITVVGIPLALAGTLLFALLLMVAWVYGQYALGTWLLSLADVDSRWAALAIGLVVVALLGAVPVLGGLVTLAVVLLGLGGIAGVAYSRRDRDGETEAA